MNKNSVHRGSVAARLSCQGALRLAIMSALGTCAVGLPGGAQADYWCEGGSTQNIPAGNYGYAYSVCQGDAGEDKSGEKDGDSGPPVSITTNGGSFSEDAGTWLPLDDYDYQLGVVTAASIGGAGVDEGSAGASGYVTINNTANISLTATTQEQGSINGLLSGISLGGQGDLTNDNNNSNGGPGGLAQAVSITNTGELTIDGTVPSNGGLFGINALAQGGGGGDQNDPALDYGDQVGGDGANASTVTIIDSGIVNMGSSDTRLKTSGAGMALAARSLGGAGGDYNSNAGTGGTVQVTHRGSTSSYWQLYENSKIFGIKAESLGADGNGANPNNPDNSDNGGDGGGDGDGWTQKVTVDAYGTVLLDLAGSDPDVAVEGAGIAARAVGGKGGKGPAKDHWGGDGGMGGAVTVNLYSGASVTTRGDNLPAIAAQSLGGQGGDADDGTALAGQGGGGGFGGAAGTVNVTTQSNSIVSTSGMYSSGIIAQSIGGGGGTGSDFVAVLGGQGGNGGNGGDAGAVTITTAGSVQTTGDHAFGVVAQSIAGSGGTGGADTSAAVALGGDGAGGGTANLVTMNNSGTIGTLGYNAHGMVGQSIGGGGGASGSATGLLSVGGNAAGSTGSSGGEVVMGNTGTITTAGNASIGIVMQSIGGGGGSGGDSKGVAGVGGAGAAGGDGASVILNDLGSVSTAGQYSPAVLAQSIGGGGGNGGDTFTASAVVSVAIGGSASGGGDGGSVCLSNHGGCANGWASYSASAIDTHGDYAPGIIAQSIGGGGGNGGSVTNVSALSFVALQMGGTGGGGGVSDEVKVGYTNLNINTGGAHSTGILAQSIGGGGGNGGSASYYDASIGFNAAVVLGGSGGEGNTGDSAIVNLSNSFIATGMDYASADPETYAPNDSFGILAQSIGGGGGNGGSSSASDMVIAVPTGEGESLAFNFQATMGGNGGAGGHACPAGESSCVTEVVLQNGSSIGTLGDGSHAIVAQSIGGGGGNGGDSSALSTILGDETTISAEMGMSMGGAGGAAGNGGAVTIALGDSGSAYAPAPGAMPLPPASSVLPWSSITTYGNFANGVLAQSIGGGGGNGGVGSSDAYTHGGPANVKLSIALGGTGGSGGTGGEVDITLNPNFVIRTLGSGSRGIVAQSIGGGGGASQGGTLSLSAGMDNAPSGRLQLGLGAHGGSGSQGGAVSAVLSGAIRTEGGDADGVLLQSIGGGGGLGGSLGADASSHSILDRIGIYNDNQQRLDDSGSTYQFGVDLGGHGGTGGNGGEVQVAFDGQIATVGDWADGLVAQSIGGGGGAGGSSTASGSKVKANVLIGLGGHGGAAGNGGDVVFSFDGSHDDSISTQGYHAYAALLQSVGGGGGLGGDGSDQATGTLTVGGSHGGDAGAGGDGGAIRTINGSTAGWLAASTRGDESVGLAMQSIGGGGGIGGAGNSASKLLEENSHAISVSVGGKGGAAGNGGTIDVTLGVNIETNGDRAHGLLAQTIGGGGGVGGAGAAGNLSSVALGGRGGAAGNGGTLTLGLNAGSVLATHGAGSHALVAQSIGGGGGIAGDTSVGIQLGADDWTAAAHDGSEIGGDGDGGVVTVNADGDIWTSGINAFGIIAQSIGGGGGLGGSAESGFAGSTAPIGGTGYGNDVTVNQSGSVSAQGEGSTGIFAQSAGPQGSGAVTVNVSGTVTGGAGPDGYAVWLVGSRQNTLNVNGTGKIVAGAGGAAVNHDGAALGGNGAGLASAAADTASLTINNAGTILGNIECADGTGGIACTAYNAATGTLSDATLYQAHINNAGVVGIGRPGSFDELAVAGDFNLQSGGYLRAVVDFEQLKSPRMVVQGDTRLDGQIDVRPTALLPDRELVVATLEGNVHGVPDALDSPVIDYAARLDGKNVRVKAANADFASPSMGLADNPRAVARHVQDTWSKGGNSAMAPLYAVLDKASRQGSDTYSSRLADLSPGVAVAPAAQMQAGMASFTGAMMSCPVFQGADAFTGEQNCVWGQVSGVNTNQDGDGGVSGFSFDGVTYQFGGQQQVSPGWFLGGSVAYQNTHMRGDDGRVSGKGDSGYAGLVLKREAGPWTFSAALSGSYGQYDIDRRIRIPGLQSQASADLDVYGAALRLRAARTFASEQFYLKPYVDVDMFYTHMPGYSESRNNLHLDVDSSNQFVMGLSPTLEVGGRVPLGNGAIMRPYMYGGVSFLSEDEYTVNAHLQGAPAGSGSFETAVPMDDVIGRIGAGLQVSHAGGIDFRLQYDGEFSSHTQSHRGSLKVMVPF